MTYYCAVYFLNIITNAKHLRSHEKWHITGAAIRTVTLTDNNKLHIAYASVAQLATGSRGNGAQDGKGGPK